MKGQAVDDPEPELKWGIVGVGDMGASIARSVMKQGFGATVYDRRQEPLAELSELGGRVAGSLAELTQLSNVISVMVVDDDQVREVVSEMASSACPGTIFVIQSTVRPSTVIEAAAVSEAVAVQVVDAAVTGGAEKATLGRLTLLIGGDSEPVRRCWPIFEAMGANLFHLGPAGAGVAGKLVNNLLSIGGYALQLEAMDLARAYGIDEEVATSFLVVGGGDSRGIRTWGRLDRLRRTHPHFGGTSEMYQHMSKDLSEAAMAAGERGVTLPLTAVAGDLLPGKMLQRDLVIADSPLDLPRCTQCNQELALPFRAKGLHPECADTFRA
jgi:3-hydroxyisobutyrate dehydrogenase-like beta-hydroxyacid dehydrogenase